MEQLSKSEKIILGSCAAAAVLSLFPWYAVSIDSEMGEMGRMFAEAGGGSANAFSAVEGVLAFLAMLATGGLLLADRAGALPWTPKARLLAPFASAVAAVVFMLFFMSRGQSFSGMGVSAGRTFWFYLALIAMGFAGYHAFQRWTTGVRKLGEDAPSTGGPPPTSEPPSSE